MERFSSVTEQIAGERAQYALEMRIRGNVECYLRMAAGHRQEQEVCARCSKPLALGASKLSRAKALFSVFVAAVAVDLATNFATGPARAVNVDVSGARADRREKLIKFSGTDATFICQVSDVCGRDGARYRRRGRGTWLSARRSIAEVRAKEHADGTSHALLSKVDMCLLDSAFEVS